MPAGHNAWVQLRNTPWWVVMLFMGGALLGVIKPQTALVPPTGAAVGFSTAPGGAIVSLPVSAPLAQFQGLAAQPSVPASQAARVTAAPVSAGSVTVSAEASGIEGIPPSDAAVRKAYGREGRSSASGVILREAGKLPSECEQKDRQLALQESYDFFEDESSESWLQRKKIHYYQRKVETDNADYCKTCVNPTSQFFWMAHYTPSFVCANARRIGRFGDGGKWICDPNKLAARAASGAGCLVYSIGSNGDYSFETSVHYDISPLCEIHTVDMNHWSKYTSVTPPPFFNYHIYKVGDGTIEPGASNVAQIVKELGHHGRVIDIFKIDCEGCEWRTFQSWFGEGVFIRQIQVEVHGLHAGVAAAHKFLKLLFDNGYVIFHKEPNLACFKCVEYSFIKMRPEFWNYDPAALPLSNCGGGEENRLSKTESFGFYDEPDESWMVRKKIAAFQDELERKNAPPDRDYANNKKYANLFYDQYYNPEFSCTWMRRLGPFGLGGKFWCDPHKITQSVDKGESCIVYSIGDAGDYAFETSVHDQVSERCQIHKFSGKMSVNQPPSYVNLHNHNVGGSQDMSAIVKKLGHSGKVIDVLKVDNCDGCEWDSFESWLGQGVFIRQLFIKVHLLESVKTVKRMMGFLRQNGYVMFYKEGDLPAEGRSVDFFFLKVGNAFFQGAS